MFHYIYTYTVFNNNVVEINVGYRCNCHRLKCMCTARVVLVSCEHGGVDLMGLKPSP